ncbi:hypothetical protein [Dermabacter hominis]|uniref:hypothetical protein n=1 Tax=Dermabacter hominis TaxID=36740 RepID=UPI0024307DCC|nr:hypothetical protein [Dermabacter hominis]
MYYDIDDKAVRGTISNTRGTVPAIETSNRDLKNGASDLGGELLHSTQTSAALTGDVASAFESAGQALVEMVNNNIDSTDDAVQKYTQGDQLMCTAANAGNQQAHVSDMPGMQ